MAQGTLTIKLDNETQKKNLMNFVKKLELKLLPLICL